MIVGSLLIVLVTTGIVVALNVAPGRRSVWPVLAFALPLAMLVWLVTLDQVISTETIDEPARRTTFAVAALLLLLLLGLAGVIPHVLSHVWPSEALEESERRLRLVLDTTRNGVVLTDGERNVVLMNRAFREMLGYSEEEIAAVERVNDLVHPADRKRVSRLATTVRNGDEVVVEYQCRLNTGEGEPVYVASRLTALNLGDPDRGLLNEVENVSGKMLAQRALERSREQLAQAQQLAQFGSYHWDLKTGEVEWSDELYRISGREPGDAKPASRPLDELLTVEDADRLWVLLKAAARDGVPWEGFAAPLQLADGRERMVEVQGRVTFDAGGRPEAVTGVVQDVTARVAADRALRDSEERFRAVFETGASGVAALDARGRATMLNAAMVEMLGYDRAELEQTSLARVLRPEDREATYDWLAGAIVGGSWANRQRMQLVCKDGALIDVDIHASPFALQGERVGAMLEVRDVTEELALRQRVESSAAETAAILETAPDAIVRINERGKIVRANAAVLAVFGWESEELTNRDVHVLITDDDRAHHQNYIEHFLRTGEASTAEGVMVGRTREVVGRRKDGTDFPIEISLAEVPDIPGTSREFTAVMRDVSERQVAERALRESEEHLLAVVDTVRGGLMLRDRGGSVLWFNQAMCNLFGYTADEFRSTPIEQLIVAEDFERARSRFSDASGGVASVGGRGETYRALRRDGTEFVLQVNSGPFTHDGEVVGVLAELHDVTEQVRLREQLLQSQKLEAVGTLVAGVAHDFNNLLTAIGGSIELAREEHGDSLWLERGSIATDRAAQLVQQLLQFSRRSDATRQFVDLRGLGEESVALLGETVDRRITIDLHDDGTPLQVWADQGQVQQVMMNLLVNARDAVVLRMDAEAGPKNYEPRIDVVFAMLELAGETLTEFRITDNGAGMPPAVRERIFDPFFTTKQVDEGTGLGLSTAYGIVSDHGGTMSVHSTPGRGTTFTVRLPSSSPGLHDDDEAGEVSANGSAPGNRRRVLVVDDEAAVIEIAHQVLSRAGYEVTSATGGDGALRQSDGGSFDLVLLDVNMPAPNGW